jgi:hypothetical protein
MRLDGHQWGEYSCERCGLKRNRSGLFWRGWFKNRLRRAGPCPGFFVDVNAPGMAEEDRAWRSSQ